LVLIMMVVASAVIMIHRPVVSPSTFYKAIRMDGTETEYGKDKKLLDNTKAENGTDKKLQADVKQDVDRAVKRDVVHAMEEAKQALDIPMMLKLKKKVTQDVTRGMKKYINQGLSKDISHDIERHVKQADSPVMKNYVTSGEIHIPSIHDPELKKRYADAWPSLLCWCIMMTVGNSPMGWMEETLVKQQLDHSIGLFACNEWAVMTDDRLALNRWGAHGFPKVPEWTDKDADITTWAIGSTQVGTGAQTNPLNAMPFRTAWKALQGSKKIEHHDWVVKVDPDTVWFPTRLRFRLKTYMPGHGKGGDNIFLKNCQRYDSMQGPIEVISQRAAINLQDNIQHCGGVWGTPEDHFIVACLQQLGVPPVMDAGLLNDKYCDGYVDCSNTWKVAFHPHKNPARFMGCYNTSTKVNSHEEKTVV